MAKLLDTNGGNTKLRKTDGSKAEYRVAGLSLYPNDTLCPYRNVAGCAAPCLAEAGRGVMRNVREGRMRKAAWFETDREGFLAQLRKELGAFARVCARQGVTGAVRLNVLSDIPWEKLGIPQEFPELYFYDYTKNPSRLGKTPANYDLIYSFSGAKTAAKYTPKAFASDAPIAVVFRDAMPKFFRGRPVIDGDASDLVNVKAGRVVVGLVAKGPAKKDTSGFVVDAGDLIALG